MITILAPNASSFEVAAETSDKKLELDIVLTNLGSKFIALRMSQIKLAKNVTFLSNC